MPNGTSRSSALLEFADSLLAPEPALALEESDFRMRNQLAAKSTRPLAWRLF